MNRPLMFINNSTILVKQLKQEIWNTYQGIKGEDFLRWYGNLNPVEKEAFKSNFEDLQ